VRPKNAPIVDYRYIDGASVQPIDADVKKLRPQD